MDIAKVTNIDTGNLSRIERGAQRSVEAAEALVAFFGSESISELEILYPERYGFVPSDSVDEAA